MSSVKDLIARLDAAKLQAEAEEAERQRLAEEEAQRLAEERIRVEKLEKEAAERARQEALEAERVKWHVDEDEAAADVARRKQEFLEANRPKHEVKEVVIKDIPALVLDVGSNTIKAGFSGEDAPRVAISAVVGRVRSEHLMDLEKHKHIDRDVYVGDDVWPHKSILDIKRVIQHGVVQNWEDFRLLIEHLLYKEMGLTREQLREHPILVTEPPLNPKANREMFMKVLFDLFDFPAMYVANSSTLALYAAGHVTGVVIECGYDVSTSVAVYDGTVIPNSLRRLNLGGRDLDLYLIRLMNERGYRFNEYKIIDEFIIRDLKEHLCFVAEDYELEMKRLKSSTVKSKWARGGNTVEATYDVRSNGNDLLPGFEEKSVPDEVNIGMERFQCAESLFDPATYLGRDVVPGGLHKMVQETVKSAPIDLARELFGNVVLSGGTTLLPGFEARVAKELRAVAAKSVDVNIIAEPTRHLGPWIGGSILASAKQFNFHWISKEEYEVFGTDLVHAPT